MASVSEQRIRFVRPDGGRFTGFKFTIGGSRFRWHPGWLPLDDGVALAQSGPVLVGEIGEGSAAGRGVEARGLQLSLRHGQRWAVLRPGDVRARNGELLVVLPHAAMFARSRLDDQAWAAEALRQFAEFQRIAQADGVIDHDNDGVGEFGDPDSVVPRRRRLRHSANGRYVFRKHLFEVHLPADVDGRERRFVAYAWPVTAVDRHDLAFAVDQRGVVFACSAHERLYGHDRAPHGEAIDDTKLGWRPLR